MMRESLQIAALAIASAVVAGYYGWKLGERTGRTRALHVVLRDLAVMHGKAQRGDAMAAVQQEGMQIAGRLLHNFAMGDEHGRQPLVTLGRGHGDS
jgi:hypothetical protein